MNKTLNQRDLADPLGLLDPDLIESRQGDEKSSGKDSLYGEGGSDVLWGGLGEDDLFGGDGNDTSTARATATRCTAATAWPTSKSRASVCSPSTSATST